MNDEQRPNGKWFRSFSYSSLRWQCGETKSHNPRTTYAYIFTFPFFGGKLKFGSDDGKKNNNVTTSTHAAATATTTTTKVTMMTMLTLNILINLWQ